MFNVVQSALRKKKKDENPKSPKQADIRLVNSGETHKNELGLGDMPPPEEMRESFDALLVCFFNLGF